MGGKSYDSKRIVPAAQLEISPSAPGTFTNPIEITDPRTLRALAHPARMEIWQFLGLEGPATATGCAEVTGLSPSACSYHLRTLAQYGFVEEDLASAADGRQRPWRARILSFSVPDSPGTAPATRVAGRWLDETVCAQAEELRDKYLERQSDYTATWQAALGRVNDVLHVSPEELSALRTRLIEVFGEYRRLSKNERPPGAQRVQVLVALIPWFEPDSAERG
jgi:DNA-binding transcriptional ArsR family regulator